MPRNSILNLGSIHAPMSHVPMSHVPARIVMHTARQLGVLFSFTEHANGGVQRAA